MEKRKAEREGAAIKGNLQLQGRGIRSDIEGQ